MKIVISPAKSLDYKSKLPTKSFSNPTFVKETKRLHQVLKKKSPAELGELMSISDKLSQLNWERNQQFSLPFTPDNARPAIYAFNGDVYAGLDAYTIPESKLDTLQSTLRILSGLYGVLKPLDLIQPYRLEMGTKMKIDKHSNLYEFWGNKITKALNDEMTDDELFVNLASNEYYGVIAEQKLKVPVITPVFKDFKNGKLKIISFYAKKARGLMVRYILDKEANTIDDIKGFDYEGYKFSEEHSVKKGELVFIR
ncbi:peroxide stress protein YaaA [Ascidiimonas sp. W6]|uniref:peroxide stress protein YaaA n=1 Tax=Ascidiimonas meishanensis TaxID=3128903 RepID=UPI0030EE6DE5